MTRRFIRAAFAALVAVLISVPLSARAQTGRIEGIWQASLQGMLRLVLHVERGAGGALSATLDSPDQGAMGLAIDAITFTGDSLWFEMRRLQATCTARMGAGDSTLVGSWKQGGMAMPLSFRRVDRVPSDRRPQDPVPPYPYDTLEVRYPGGAKGDTLAGTLTLPPGKGPFPCAVLITGSGPENRDEEIFNHRPFRVLADHLTRQGIAVLRSDDRGVAKSTGKFEGATSVDFAADVQAGIAFLKTRREINPRRIGLIGHSEGGLIAPIVATESKDVAFIVLMAGPGIRGDTLLFLQSAALRRLMGASEDMIAREGAAMRRVQASLRAGDEAGTIRATREMVAIQTEGLTDEQRRAIGDPDSVAFKASRQFYSPWMRFFLDYEPRPTLAKVKCPVLALNGSKDFQVPPNENLTAIRAALAAGGNRDATVKELPGLNHLFQTANTGALSEYAAIEETIAPSALAEMSGWVLAHTTGKK